MLIYVRTLLYLFNAVQLCRQLSTFCDSYLKSIAETEVTFVKDQSKSYFQIISQGNVSLFSKSH